MSPIKSFLNQGPAATVLIVLLVLAAGVVSLVDPDEIDFKQWWTISTAVGAALAVGRGFAAKGDVSTSTNGLRIFSIKFLGLRSSFIPKRSSDLLWSLRLTRLRMTSISC